MEDGEQTDETNTQGTETDSTNTLFDKTNEATERLEKANKEKKKLLDREEALYAKQKLGGQSTAGQPSEPQKSPEEKKKAKASEFFKGTALGDAIDKA